MLCSSGQETKACSPLAWNRGWPHRLRRVRRGTDGHGRCPTQRPGPLSSSFGCPQRGVRVSTWTQQASIRDFGALANQAQRAKHAQQGALRNHLRALPVAQARPQHAAPLHPQRWAPAQGVQANTLRFVPHLSLRLLREAVGVRTVRGSSSAETFITWTHTVLCRPYTWPGGCGCLSKKVRMLWPARATTHFFARALLCVFLFRANTIGRPWRRGVCPQAACAACASSSSRTSACATERTPLLSAQTGCCKSCTHSAQAQMYAAISNSSTQTYT